MKAKVITSLGLALTLIAPSVCAQNSEAPENRFELLAKAIAPVIALFTPGGSAGSHALNLQALVTEVSGLPAQISGAPVHIAFEFPDKLLVQFPTSSGTATVCRDRQRVWAFPARQFAPLVEKVGTKNSKKPLPPFQIDETKAVLLPALFDVHDAGSVKVAEQSYRVLDVRLVPELETKELGGWPVRLWIRPDDHRVAQIELRAKDWTATLTIETLELAPTLPPSTWQPTPEQHDQVMAVPGKKIGSLLQLALKQDK
jgi:outer membrane lipoprotein-sorting protein